MRMEPGAVAMTMAKMTAIYAASLAALSVIVLIVA